MKMTELLVFLALLAAAPGCFGQGTERPKLPTEEIELRTRLEADPSMVHLTCGLMIPIDPKEMYAATGTVQQAQNTRLRLAFYKAALENRTMRVSYDCGTDEGGIIKYYLLSEKGKLAHVADFSRDPFGGLRMLINQCSDLKLGQYVSTADRGIVYEHFDLKDANGKVAWLSCRSENTLHTF